MLSRHSLTPLLLFALLAALLVGSWWFIQDREARLLLDQLGTTVRQVAARVDVVVEQHIGRIEKVGQRLLLAGDLDRETFTAISLDYQGHHPGLLALNWVDDDGRIRWVAPEGPNRAAAGFDLDEHPIAGEAFRRARAGESIAVTRPLELLQGGWGFALYHRLERGGETLGFLNAVFRLPDLLEPCLDEPLDRRFAFLLHDGATLLGAFGPEPTPAERGLVASADVHIGPRTLTLGIVPRLRSAPATATWVDEALLVLGLALALGLALLVRTARIQRRRAERTSRELRLLIDNSPDAIFVLDAASGTVLDGNRRAGTLLDRDCGSLVGLGLAELCAPCDADSAGPPGFLLERLARARSGRMEFLCQVSRREGDVRTAEVHFVGMSNGDGDRVLASVLDVTEHHRLEQQLRRAESIDAMGELAGGVAHDFNNLLTAILGSCELMAAHAANDEIARALAQTAIETCERAATLTQQLLAFSRHAAIKPTTVDLDALVDGLVPMLVRVLGEQIRIETDLRTARHVYADHSQLELLLLNLAVNARDAMPSGGRLSIRTRDVGEDQVELAVEDEGQGVPAAIIDRLFEPYFTTKRPGAGTGIGLATAKRIVEQARGTITVDSQPGRGATFRVILPMHVGAVELMHRARHRPLARGQETVLLVEDDPDVRATVARTLGDAGYRVATAESAERALEVARSIDDLGVLVSDVVLPKASGPDLLRRLRADRPGLPCLLMSGYSAAEFRLEGPDMQGVELLLKPFLPSDLTEKLRAMLVVRPA